MVLACLNSSVQDLLFSSALIGRGHLCSFIYAAALISSFTLIGSTLLSNHSLSVNIQLFTLCLNTPAVEQFLWTTLIYMSQRPLLMLASNTCLDP